MPLALAGLALGAVGTGLSAAGAAKSRSAMSKTRAQFAAKQGALQDQSNDIFQDSLSKSTRKGAGAAISKGASDRQTAWHTLNDASAPIATALPATSTSAPTNRAAKIAGGAASAWNNLNAGNQARAAGYGDWEDAQARKDADEAQKLGVINNFSQGDARVLPGELDAASRKGDALSGWGNIVSSLGSLAGTAGASGAFGKTVASAGAKAIAANPYSISNTPSVWANLFEGAPEDRTGTFANVLDRVPTSKFY